MATPAMSATATAESDDRDGPVDVARLLGGDPGGRRPNAGDEGGDPVGAKSHQPADEQQRAR